MEEQIPASSIPQSVPPVPNPPFPGQVTPEMVEAFKYQAKQQAIRQLVEQHVQQPKPVEQYLQPPSPAEPQVVYLRRNLTVAELGLIILLACGVVTGVQAAWNFGSSLLPRIEIKVK